MTRQLVFMPDAWDDYLYWQGQDRKTLKRINQLIQTPRVTLSMESASLSP